MLGVIPNPKKNIKVDYSLADVTQAVEHLPLLTARYKLVKSTPAFNLFTFHSFEFLSAGVYIDVFLSSITETKTEIDLEVGKANGSFDKSHEISLANDHLATITDLLTESLNTPVEKRTENINAITKAEIDKKVAEQIKNDEFKKKMQAVKKSNPIAYHARRISVGIFIIAVLIVIWYFIMSYGPL